MIRLSQKWICGDCVNCRHSPEFKDKRANIKEIFRKYLRVFDSQSVKGKERNLYDECSCSTKADFTR